MTAVKQNGHALGYIDNKTPEICLAAVKQNGDALRYVDVQSPELCMAAVQRDGRALQFVEMQTPELCMTAVRRQGLSLQYVKTQTRELCLAAIQKNPKAARYIKPELRAQLKSIEPTEFVELPEGLKTADFTDAITMEEPVTGEVHGFLVESDHWYLAGSLTQFNEMIAINFRDSTKHNVFVPFKNALVPVAEIRWVRL